MTAVGGISLPITHPHHQTTPPPAGPGGPNAAEQEIAIAKPKATDKEARGVLASVGIKNRELQNFYLGNIRQDTLSPPLQRRDLSKPFSAKNITWDGKWAITHATQDLNNRANVWEQAQIKKGAVWQPVNSAGQIVADTGTAGKPAGTKWELVNA